LTFTGTLTPAHSGEVVLLERESRSGINFYVAGSTTVNPDSTYSISYTSPNGGPSTVRLRVPGDTEDEGAASEPFTIGVMPSPAVAPGDELASPLPGQG
jgi:hypothetical protein